MIDLATIEELERLEASATPGEWRASMSGYSVKSDDPDCPIVAAVHGGSGATKKQFQLWNQNLDLIAALRNHARALLAAAREAVQLRERVAELEKRVPDEPFDKRCADALADEVAVLVRNRAIDSRSPAADALLDYRNPPSTLRADRLAELESAAREAVVMRERVAKMDRRRQQSRESTEIEPCDHGKHYHDCAQCLVEQLYYERDALDDSVASWNAQTAETVQLRERNEQMRQALVQARATLKLADEAPDRFDTAQANVTFKQIHEALEDDATTGTAREVVQETEGIAEMMRVAYADPIAMERDRLRGEAVVMREALAEAEKALASLPDQHWCRDQDAITGALAQIRAARGGG
jgi:hypothetical protein